MTTPAIRALLITAGLALASAPAVAQKVYRWVDENGQVHYGDRVPPQYAKQDREVLNKQGVAVAREEGLETPEQARLRMEREERQKAEQERARRDRVLLATYQSIAEIELLRTRRLEVVDADIVIHEQSVANLKARLKEQQDRAKPFQPINQNPKARPMPEGLAEDIARTRSDLRTQEDNLRRKQEERSALNARFDADVVRFKELHAARR